MRHGKTRIEKNLSIYGLEIVGTPTTSGQTLTSISGSQAVWQSPPAGSFSLSFTSQEIVNNILTVTHNLNTTYPLVAIYNNDGYEVFPDEIISVSASEIQIDLSGYEGSVDGTWNLNVLANGSAGGGGGAQGPQGPQGAAGASGSIVSYDSNVNNDNSISLLLHMNGSNGSNNFTDNSYVSKTLTAYNGASISTSQSKFGGASGLFVASSGNYVSSTSSVDYAFGTGDFTIESWVYPNSYGSSNYLDYGGSLIDTRSSPSSGTGILIVFDTSGHIRCWSNGLILQSTNAVSLNAWSHIAVVRKNGVLKVFINGVFNGSENYTYNLTDQTCILGTTFGNFDGDTNFKFDGYLDEVRLSKGLARYVDTFTPPTSAFPNAIDISTLPSSPVANQIVYTDSGIYICTQAGPPPSWKFYRLASS